jgi:ubiquinone/menaquinone biosynthesis C-methylase UbiE
MIRLESKNSNTKENYNRILLEHYNESGLDFSDMWRIKWLLKRFDMGKLLDIGCGVSPLSIIASEKSDTEVWAIDFADKFIKLLKGKSKVNYVVCDMNTLPFKDKEFDYVVLGEVLEHSENPEKLVDEVKRVLKPTGIVAISCPNGETIESHLYSQHIWGITENDIRELFNVIELKIIDNSIMCYAQN